MEKSNHFDAMAIQVSSDSSSEGRAPMITVGLLDPEEKQREPKQRLQTDNLPLICMATLKQSSGAGFSWTLIDGVVYDIGSYLN